MTADAEVKCSCCGSVLPDTDRFDVRFGLPDAALDLPESAVHRVNAGLLRVDGHGCFARCLLSLRLSGGLEVGLGTWMRISEDDLARALARWDEPEYADLALTGRLANVIRPWGEEILGAALTASVVNANEIPYVQSSDHPVLSRVLGTVWDRHEVLSHFGHPLPVAVQTPLDDQWSIERTAGMAARVVDGTSRFAGPGRTVQAGLFGGPPTGTPASFLSSLIEYAPRVDEEHQITEEFPGGLRHAFWLVSAEDGHERHDFHGFVVHGHHAVGVACTYDDPEGLAWAQHVWRSVAVVPT